MGRPSGTKNVMRTPEEKEKLVLEYLNSKEGYRRIAENNDVYPSIFLKWIKLYREQGIDDAYNRGELKDEAGDTPFMTIFTFGEYGTEDHGQNRCSVQGQRLYISRQ